MRIMDIIGTVTLSRCHPSLDSLVWKVAVPLTRDGLAGQASGREEPVVICDELGAGIGSRVAVSESAEAAAPFHPQTKPVDGYNAAILDQINL